MEEQLELNIRARNAAIWLPSIEEDRSVPRIQAVAEKLGYVVFEWDCIAGFRQLSSGTFRQPGDGHCTNVDQALGAVTEYKHQPTVFVFRDFHPLVQRLSQHVEYVLLTRRTKDLYRALKQNGNAVVFLASSAAMPTDLEDCLTLVEAALPDERERSRIATAWIAANAGGLGCTLDEEGIHRLVSATAGMTSRQIQAALAISVVKRKALGAGTVDDLLAEKVKAVKASEVLEYVPLKESLGDIGGMAGIKDWINKRSMAFTQAAVRYGLPLPKGILVTGPPGVGKSLLAKAAANALHMPLLRLDVGRLQASLVGQSEERLRRALALAEAQAPCVVWIDEVEKAFAGARGPSGDSGVTQRMFGGVLTWMQERTKPVFVFATCNRISDLPPELLRKGRFDETFYADLPTASERRAILDVLLRKYGQKSARLITESLVNRLDRFTGSEIEAVITEAMFEAFSDRQRPITAADMEAATTRVLPLADQMRDEIEALRRWGKASARSAT
jgi:ATP-dependent 26S proteasome regulatory subunit